MKKLFVTVVVILSAVLSLPAQTTNEEFKTRYETQVKRLGYDGIGVETLLDRWEKAFPEDLDMLLGKYNYYLSKSVSSQIVPKDQDRFLGAKPMLSLKDSLGKDVKYFQENFYVDSLFALSSQAIDKAIKLFPDRLDLRIVKITSLIGYEKESPELSYGIISDLIAYNKSARPKWKSLSEPAAEGEFEALIQDFCFSLFKTGSEQSYLYFKNISALMAKQFPKNLNFLCNVGTYYLIAADNPKTALKYYGKVLKSDPGNETARTNSELARKKMAESR